MKEARKAVAGGTSASALRVVYRVLESSYLASLLGGLLGKDEGYIPLFQWMRAHTGLRPARAYERLHDRRPTAEEAALLNISRDQSVIDMERWVWADDGTLFEYSPIVANAALHEYAYSLRLMRRLAHDASRRANESLVGS